MTMSSGKTLVVGNNLLEIIENIDFLNGDKLTIYLASDKIETINNQVKQLTTAEGKIIPAHIREKIKHYSFHSRNYKKPKKEELIEAPIMFVSSTFHSTENEDLIEVLQARGGADAVWIDEAHRYLSYDGSNNWKKNIEALIEKTT